MAIKPCGIVSEATPDHNGMPDLLGEKLSYPAASIYPVHRLDATTGGLTVYALTKPAAASLSAALAERRFSKTYLALCEGIPVPSEGEMEDELFFDRRKRQSFVVNHPRKGTKSASLSYRVLRELTVSEMPCAMCAVSLYTGRTHQIRVQFASRRHPLLGDKKYGARIPWHGMALWCSGLSFPDPDTGDMVSFQRDFPECP